MPGEPSFAIEVERTDVERFMSTFSVQVSDGAGPRTVHTVTLSGADWERLGEGYLSPEALVQASFAFLLEREPKEQILASFDLSQIARYFSDYERTISRQS